MAIAIIVTDRDTTILRQTIIRALNGTVEVLDYREVSNHDSIQMVVVWKHPNGILDQYSNLKLVSSLGAGVEHMVNDPTLPTSIPLTRIVTPSLTISMFKYVLFGVLQFEKQFPAYQAFQAQKVWYKGKALTEKTLTIGVLGLGALGGTIAQKLSKLGYQVLGFSRTSKKMEGVLTFGENELTLPQFLTKVNLVINLLPLTPKTTGILNYQNLKHLPKGAFLINVARGKHLIEADLLKCLKEGIIQGALLDVFQAEPLPEDHAFWEHPNIMITPHIASVTSQKDAGIIIAENYRRLQSNRPLRFEVDRPNAY